MIDHNHASYTYSDEKLQNGERDGFNDALLGYPSRASCYPVNTARYLYVRGFQAGTEARSTTPRVGILPPDRRFPMCAQLDHLRNFHPFQWSRYLCYRSYRRVGYSPAEARIQAEAARPSYHWHSAAGSDESRFLDAIADARIVFDARTSTYIAYASGYEFSDGSLHKPSKYRYWKRGATAKGAYADLCRAIRFDLRLNNPDLSGYWLAKHHGQPVYNG